VVVLVRMGLGVGDRPCSIHKDTLKSSVARHISELPSSLHMRLQSNVKARWASNLGRVDVGTLFSGCEIFYDELTAIQMFLAATMSMTFEFEHTLAAENVEWKRQFIMDRHAPRHCFGDVVALAANDWVGTDHVSGKTIRMPSVHLLAAGFECDTVSLFNTSRNKDKKECMKLGTGKTGTTGNAALQYITDHRVPVAILENNKTFGSDNIQYIVDYFNAKGFFVIHRLVDAEEYGSCSKRSRQYFVVFEITDGTPIDQSSATYLPPPWSQGFDESMRALKRTVGDPQTCLLQFLVQTPSVQNAICDIRAKRSLEFVARSAPTEGKENKKQKKDDEWLSIHLDVYRAHDMKWPPAIEELDPKLYENVRHLPTRVQEAAFFHTHKPRQDNHRGVPTYHDLMPNLAWLSEIRNILPTLTCGAIIFDRLNKYVLSGGECLLAQGFHLQHLLAQGQQLSNSNLMELAGNAFNGFALSAILVSTLTVYPWSRAEVRALESQSIRDAAEYEEATTVEWEYHEGDGEATEQEGAEAGEQEDEESEVQEDEDSEEPGEEPEEPLRQYHDKNNNYLDPDVAFFSVAHDVQFGPHHKDSVYYTKGDLTPFRK
jgi:site-specific DNA-cytosine methylase